MADLFDRYHQTRSALLNAAREFGRHPESITLLAVSKTRPAEDISNLYRIGQRDFGENYLQDALAKQRRLAHLDLRWHFIGPVQSNKTRQIAARFHWVHTLDRTKIAQRLNQQRPDHLPPLNVCLQINIDDETSKSGVTLMELPQLVESVLELNRLKLRGLMVIPRPKDDFEQQRQTFSAVKATLDEFNQRYKLAMDTLSMGMSADLRAAIAAGSTMVRIGTAIFGPRNH